GPAEWDLVSVAIRQRRFGLPVEELLGFCAAYRFDLLSWEHFEALLRVRELLDCSFALAVSEDHPGATQQIEVRVRAWLDPAHRSCRVAAGCTWPGRPCERWPRRRRTPPRCRRAGRSGARRARRARRTLARMQAAAGSAARRNRGTRPSPATCSRPLIRRRRRSARSRRARPARRGPR